MPTITLNGPLFHRGIGGDPVVFVETDDQAGLRQWWEQNDIFTQLFEHPHPTESISCPVVYMTENHASQIQNGDAVILTIDVRPEARGVGIKTIDLHRRIEAL